MAASTPTVPHKAFTVPNVRTYIPIILDPKLHNYDLWRSLFTTVCTAFDAKDHIDASYDPPNQRPTNEEWLKVDAVVTMWMYTTMTQELIHDVLDDDACARVIWLNIEKSFRDNKDARALQIDSELRSISMGDLTVQSYCAKIKHLADLLERLDKNSKIPDKYLVIYTINGLSSRFDNVGGIIHHRNPMPSFSETKSMLMLEE